MHSATLFEGGLVAGAGADSMDRRPEQRIGRDGAISFPRHAGGRWELRHHLRHADLPAVAEVRRVLREQLHRWGVPGLVDTAELLTSEIVTNALVHTDRGAVLTATLTSGAARRLRVEVRDFTAHRPRVRHPTDHASSGRGLLLVQALADTWGVRPQGPGKTVWFELAADPA